MSRGRKIDEGTETLTWRACVNGWRNRKEKNCYKGSELMESHDRLMSWMHAEHGRKRRFFIKPFFSCAIVRFSPPPPTTLLRRTASQNDYLWLTWKQCQPMGNGEELRVFIEVKSRWQTQNKSYLLSVLKKKWRSGAGNLIKQWECFVDWKGNKMVPIDEFIVMKGPIFISYALFFLKFWPIHSKRLKTTAG